jgi:hypothetical protein
MSKPLPRVKTADPSLISIGVSSGCGPFVALALPAPGAFGRGTLFVADLP